MNKSKALLGANWLWVLLLIALWLGCTAWIRPLMLPDEGRYASVAWEMLASGDWLTPTLNGLPFFHKPPLFYWISGAALAVTGQTEFAARAGSLVGATLAGISLFLFTLRWSGPEMARRAVLVLMVQPLLFLGAQFANLDMLVAGCITATILCLAHTALSFEAGQKYRSALMLSYALAALGVLAKGLIGFVLPAMVIFLWLLLRRRWRSLWALISLPGLLLFLLVAAPWFVLMQQKFDGFLHYFFVVQHFQRFASSGFNNAQPVWFYPLALAACSLPCLLFGKQLLRKNFWRSADQLTADLRLLMGLFVLCIVVFFSLPQSKLIGYIIPAVPALAWLMANASLASGQASLDTSTGIMRWKLALLVSALIGGGVVTALTVNQKYSNKAMGLELHQRLQVGEPVYMLKKYIYDLPFYAQLKQPVRVVDDWAQVKLNKNDNWQHELLDAAEFNSAVGSKALVQVIALKPQLCAGSVSWLVGRSEVVKDFPFLAQAEQVFAQHGLVLWRIDGRALGAGVCATGS